MSPAGGGASVRVWALAGIGGAVVVAVLLTVRLFPSVWAVGVAVVDIDQSAGPDVGVNLSEVATHPEVMWGRTVTISGAVAERRGPRAMVIGNDAIFVGEEVLVVGGADLGTLVEPAGDTLDGAEVVRVTGEVRRFEPDALAAELGVERGSLAGYGREAVLVAAAVEPDPPAHAGPGDKEFPAGSSGYDIGVTMNDLDQRTEAYLGETVQVSDEIDEPALGPHAFVLGDEQVLVVLREPNPEVFLEATGYVTGRVRRFDLAEVERDLGIDLDDAQMERFAGEPMILATAVEVVA